MLQLDHGEVLRPHPLVHFTAVKVRHRAVEEPLMTVRRLATRRDVFSVVEILEGYDVNAVPVEPEPSNFVGQLR